MILLCYRGLSPIQNDTQEDDTIQLRFCRLKLITYKPIIKINLYEYAY